MKRSKLFHIIYGEVSFLRTLPKLGKDRVKVIRQSDSRECIVDTQLLSMYNDFKK